MILKDKLTSVQRIEVASDRMADNNLLDTALQADVDNIMKTLEDTDRREFEKVVGVRFWRRAASISSASVPPLP